MFPSTSGSPPHIAQGQARRNRSSGRYDSTPSLQRIASSFPINCKFFSSNGIVEKNKAVPSAHQRGRGGLVGGIECRLRPLPWRRPHAENGGADANECRTFFDRDCEVAAHSHRKTWQFEMEFGSQPIT